MNSQDDRGWPEVDRRKEERREVGPPQHVTVDGLSNGARMLVETMIEETREMRREVNDARKSLVKWAAGAVVTLAVALGGSIWGAARWSQQVEQDVGIALDVRAFVERRTAELAEELAANGAGDELTRSAQLQNAIEFKTRLDALENDVDRIDGRLP